MEKSNLRFSNPTVQSFVMLANPNYNAEEGGQLQDRIETNVAKTNDNKASVILRLSVGDAEFSNNTPYWVEVIMRSVFAWDDVYDEQTVDKLLAVNAPAMLLSYARPLVASMTNNGPYPVYNVPFYNFTKE